MRRALGIIAVGVLVGLAIVWLVMSQSPSPSQRPAADRLRPPAVPAR
jgi:hypothetical protein